jgi:hypothetical protein
MNPLKIKHLVRELMAASQHDLAIHISDPRGMIHTDLQGSAPVLTFYREAEGTAYDVVDGRQMPNESNTIATLHLGNHLGMQELLIALGIMLPYPQPVGAHLQFDKNMWVAYDETATEFYRDSNYLKVRKHLLEYAVLNASQHRPEAGDTWAHSNGAEYKILMLTNQYSDRDEYPCTVVYQGHNGKVWSKPLANFLQKMFLVSKASAEPQEQCAPDNHPQFKSITRGIVEPVGDCGNWGAAIDAVVGGRDWGEVILVHGSNQANAEILRELVITGLQHALAHLDNKAFDTFAEACKAKLAKSREKGRGGWENPEECSNDDLSRMLWEHVGKGDPIDVANFCMMLSQRGETIAKRESLDFETLLAKHHKEVWDAAESEEDDRPAYDEAGENTAEELIALFQGYTTYKAER